MKYLFLFMFSLWAGYLIGKKQSPIQWVKETSMLAIGLLYYFYGWIFHRKRYYEQLQALDPDKRQNAYWNIKDHLERSDIKTIKELFEYIPYALMFRILEKDFDEWETG